MEKLKKLVLAVLSFLAALLLISRWRQSRNEIVANKIAKALQDLRPEIYHTTQQIEEMTHEWTSTKKDDSDEAIRTYYRHFFNNK